MAGLQSLQVDHKEVEKFWILGCREVTTDEAQIKKALDPTNFLKPVQKDEKDNLDNETKALSRVPYNNCVVRCFGYGEIKDCYFISLQGFGLGDLERYAKGKELSLNDVKSVVRQTALGLQHCLENGVVHRDVKGANILLSCTSPLQVVLSDFDLSKIFESREAALTARMSESVGSLKFKAPEVFQKSNIDEKLIAEVDFTKADYRTDMITHLEERGGSGEPPSYTYKCDMWSLGILSYKLASGGRFPFVCSEEELSWVGNLSKKQKEDWSASIIWYKIKRQNMKAIVQSLSQNKSFNSLVERLLNRDPNSRPEYFEILGHPALK